MYVGRDLVFVQLQKTASTHVARLLHALLGGLLIEGPRKHAPIPPVMRDRFVLGSIRDPWAWYVSLWSFGVAERGALQLRVTRRTTPDRAAQWREVYRSVDDVAGFRRWLTMIHDPVMAQDLREGFEPGAVPYGLLTHRYRSICWDTGADDVGGSTSDLLAADRQRCYVDAFVRVEDLERTLVDNLERVVGLTSEQRARIETAGFTNRSPRSLDRRAYYDASSARLVAEREALVVERFGYESPI